MHATRGHILNPKEQRSGVAIYKRRLKIFYKNGKNVGMAQKGQKQEGMSCGEVFAVCGFYTQGYCTTSLHLAAACS